MPPPPPPLMDELVEEVLLRLPPDSPASLVRAGLVCKRWCHLVSDPAFRRRFIDFHGRAPPMLGFLTYTRRDDTTRFVPTSAFGGLPHAKLLGLKPCDARHGRVLLHTTEREYDCFRIVVWNPITGEQLKLPDPPRWGSYQWTAAVLCAAAAATGCACDHLDCHGGPFIVVLVGTGCYKNYVCVYNSEAGAWSEPTFALHSGGSIQRSVRSILVGNTLCFLLHESGCSLLREFRHNRFYRNILEYNLDTMRISIVKLPAARECNIREPFGPIEFTTMEDGRLGFVRVEDWRLNLWSRELEEPGWALCKAITFMDLLPFHDSPWHQWPSRRYLVGSVEGANIIFLAFKDELFTVDLRSARINKVYPHRGSCITASYMNFCTPVFRAPFSSEGPRSTSSGACTGLLN